MQLSGNRHFLSSQNERAPIITAVEGVNILVTEKRQHPRNKPGEDVEARAIVKIAPRCASHPRKRPKGADVRGLQNDSDVLGDRMAHGMTRVLP